jgi:lipopolysaccharide/colanic/teichoic acid biosynthesis glycosyltransferase
MEIQPTEKTPTVPEADFYKLIDIQEFNKRSLDQSEVSDSAQIRELLFPYKLNSVFREFIIKNLISYTGFFCLDETSCSIIDQLKENQFESIINREPFNNVSDVNTYLEKINTKLKSAGMLFGYFVDSKSSVYTLETTRRLLKKHLILIHNLRSAWISFIKILKKITFMSKAEFFGRLSCYGFEVLDEFSYSNKLFFVAEKKRSPLYIKKKQYGLIIRLPRVCKNGNIKHFYKIRTMYPYSEYLQDYLLKVQGLQDGGKFKGDFRVSPAGKFLRKYWIDELPMIINFLKGDVKLVGVRPLSKHYFSLYSKELQSMRIKTKPGLIPPFYVDFPKSLDEIMESEKKYLLAYKKHPIMTDIAYLYKALINILFNGYRSK